jgi:hypothetical protein
MFNESRGFKITMTLMCETTQGSAVSKTTFDV